MKVYLKMYENVTYLFDVKVIEFINKAFTDTFLVMLGSFWLWRPWHAAESSGWDVSIRTSFVVLLMRAESVFLKSCRS